MMKKLIIITCVAILSFPSISYACDICGCGVGSYYIGILPEFKKRFIGLRYQYKGLTSHISPDGSYSYLTSKEKYQTMELWGAYNLGKRFRVLGFIPYNINERINQDVSTIKSGLGDIAMVGYYQLFSNSASVSNNKLLVHSLWIGAGVKFATGKYDPSEKTGGSGNQNNFQLGTGSTDFTLNAMYDLRIMDAGININGGYKMNTVNRYDYKYGNKMTFNLLAYYKFNIENKFTIAPNAGLLYEKAAKDLHNSQLVQESGGNSTMGIIGAEISIGKIGFGGNFQTPISQNLSGGTVYAGNRAMVHISFAF